jgi:hypothetical protein
MPDAGPDGGPIDGGPDAGPPDGGPDAGPPPTRFEPRAIYRSPAAAGPGFADGTEIFTAGPDWEGGEVFDPWVIALPTGGVRLYYASLGGIGAADAPAADGTFTRTGDAALLAPDVAIWGGAIPRRPTVVHDGAQLVLYYEAGDAIWRATSTDGLAFTRDPAPLALNLTVDAGYTEARLSSPGAVRIRTTTGRDVTRLYFTSHRSDGTQALALAASEDGLRFERAVPVVFMDSSGADHEAFPAPWVLDDRVTLLYFSVDRVQRRNLTRALAVGVSPGSIRYQLPE